MRGFFFICLLLLTSSLFAAKKPAKMAAPPKIPPGQPEIFSLEPRGIQRGVPAKIKLTGTNLIGLAELRLHNKNIQGVLLDQPAATTNEVWISITAATNLVRGAYELSVKNTNSESSKLKLYVDDLPQVYELSEAERPGKTPSPRPTPLHPPFSL